MSKWIQNSNGVLIPKRQAGFIQPGMSMFRKKPGGGDDTGGDPYWDNVVSLLHFNGVNNSTIFTDEKGTVWTPTNNAKISSAQAKFGGSSLYLDGNSSLQSATNAAFALLTGDYTIEFFIYPLTLSTQHNMVMYSDSSLAIYQVNSANIRFWNGADRIIGGNLAVNTWNFITLARKAGLTNLYLNGVSIGSYNDAKSYTTTAFWLGVATAYVNGYIAELRITKGVARYTTNFTPPNAPFPSKGLSTDIYWKNVAALLHFDGANGDTTVLDATGRAWNPLGNGNQISTDQAKFGQSLKAVTVSVVQPFATPTTPVGTQDFTYEAWLYRAAATGINFNAPGYSANNLAILATNKFQFSNGSVWAISSVDVPIGQWVHVAASRVAGVLYLFVNGQLGYSGALTTSLPVMPYMINGQSGATAYVDEYRVTIGVGRYTANFTPPATPFTLGPANDFIDPATGVNVALGKLVIGDGAALLSSTTGLQLTTDGILNSGNWTSYATAGLHNVIVDMGVLYNIDTVKVWHYYADSRTYNATKTEISKDGTNWITIFDSAVSGTYVETAAGHALTFTKQPIRYIRDWCNGSSANTGCHWSEIQAIRNG